MKKILNDKAVRRHYLIKKLSPLDPKVTVLYTGIFNSNKDEHTALHKHKFLELMCITSEIGHVMIRHQNYELRRGDVVVYYPDTLHCEWGTKSNDIEGIFFAVKYTDSLKKALENSKIGRVFRVSQDKYYMRLFNAVLEESKQDETTYTGLLVDSFAKALIIRLLRDNTQVETPLEENEFVTQLKSYIDEHYLEDINLENLYKELHVSYYYGSRVFKKLTGLTPINYIVGLRIQKACELILKTNMKIGDIAYEVGYKDVYYFTKSFKKEIGVTPLKYRKTNVIPY